jgi:hypothetical protein
MAVTNVLGPEPNEIKSAYRPIIFDVTVPGAPKVVYCDLYFNGRYYKTLSKTQYHSRNSSGSYSYWKFDIADACQEFLQKVLAPIDSTLVQNADKAFIGVYCRFRDSQLDADGLIIPEGPVPVQGTMESEPVPGGGQQSTDFFVLNVALKHHHEPSLANHLSRYMASPFDENCYPLSRRPRRYHISLGSSDFYPVIDTAFQRCSPNLRLNYKYFGQSSFSQASSIASYGVIVSTITSLSVVQIGDLISLNWQYTGNPSSFNVQVDAGIVQNTPVPSIELAGLSVGSHTVAIRPISGCAQGTQFSTNITVDEAAELCNLEVYTVLITQTGADTIQVGAFMNATAPSYAYSLDGGPNVPVAALPFTVSGITPGGHTLKLTPVCDDDRLGVPATASFTQTPSPSITQTSNTTTGVGGTRTQVFLIGPNVNPGNRYTVGVYSYVITVVAVAGDTPSSIATKLRDAVNGTTTAQWNSFGVAPAPGTAGYPPNATASGAYLTLKLNHVNSFSASAFIS